MGIQRDDVISHQEYAKLRSKFVQQVIDEKKIRRVRISDRMSGVFENRLTVWFQIQEMIHIEKIEDEEHIQEMIEVYNELMPLKNELSMTLFVEIPDQQALRAFNSTIVGIENHVQLVFGDHTVTSYEMDADDDNDKYTQSVHYLHFPFNEEQKEAFLNQPSSVTLKVSHPNYQCEVQLSEELVKEMQKQLAN